MQRALAKGTKTWNRSKVVLLGEGAVGKTTLLNNMMDKPFTQIETTVGLAQVTCNVQRNAVSNDHRWQEYQKPEIEYEACVAQLIDNMTKKKQIVSSSKTVSPAKTVSSAEEMSKLEKDSNVMTSSNVTSNVRWKYPITPEKEVTTSSVPQLTRITELANGYNDKNQMTISNESSLDKMSNSLNPRDQHFTNLYDDDIDINIQIKDDNNIILSLFDISGQSIFHIIHNLFLTSHSIYLIVFNMNDILNDNKRDSALNELLYWINSIVIYTYDSETNKTAPIFLVGTHKDEISNKSKHQKISDIIENKFRYNARLTSFVKFDDLYFYPIDNLEGRRDDVIVTMMRTIESVVVSSDYAQEPRPLTWMKALDALLATKKTSLLLVNVYFIATENGVEEDEVVTFLSFLNEIGVVLWLDKPGLRDVVIIDIMSSFIGPVTRIICNHVVNPTYGNKTKEFCMRCFPKEWDFMVNHGIIDRRLIDNILLYDKAFVFDVLEAIDLMLKYGLIVKLELSAGKVSDMYFVPTLVPPTVVNPNVLQDNTWKHVRNYQSCYFVFTAGNQNIGLISTWLDQLSMKNGNFLPNSLIEILIGKAVTMSPSAHLSILKDRDLFKNYIVLSFERQLFRLVYIPELSCIRLDVEGEYPLPVYNRIRDQIDKTVKDYFGMLQFITALPFGIASESDDDFLLLNLETIREIYEQSNSIHEKGYPTVDRNNVVLSYSPWLINSDSLSSYDVFISHSWNDIDNKISDTLYDEFLDRTVGSEKRVVNVFLHKLCTKHSHRVRSLCSEGIFSSIVLIPILSMSALLKMLTHNPDEEDSLLIEWMLALECMQDQEHSKMQGIYPLMLGETKADGSVGNLFADGIIDRLPVIVPTASIAIAKSMLDIAGIKASRSFSNRTVRGTITELLQFSGLYGWAVPVNTVVWRTVDDVLKILDSTGSDISQVTKSLILVIKSS